MTVEYTGNSIPAPSLVRDDVFTTDEELLWSSDHNYTQKGVTLKSGQGVLKAGTLLSRDSGTKKYVKETTPDNALGILRKTVDTGSSASDAGWMGNILYSGLLKYSLMQSANSGVTLTGGFLGSTVNTVEGFFKF